MNRDTIIRLAREAGGVPAGGGTFIAGTIDWERFAALVAAAEREACAKVSEKHSHRSDDMGAIIGRAIRARGQQ